MTGTERKLSLRWILGLTTLFLAAVLVSPARVDAQVPRLLSFQGFLASSGGVAVSATLQMTFKLYDGPSGGAAQVWSETQTVPVANGVYSVILGSLTSLPANFSVPYWMGVTVGTDPEMTPRQALVSAPYALHAERAGCNPGDQTICYTGPAGTLNVGPCSSGIRTCDAQGIPGNCVGEITPSSEVCGNAIDDNCNTTVDEGCTGPNGTACTFNSECTSSVCVDGVCCNTGCTGTCQACSSAKTGSTNGTCANIPNGADPDNECAGSAFCSGFGACVSPIGTACTMNNQCQSSICVDGFCCNSSCASTCMACSNAKTGTSNGVCSPVIAGTDPDAECALACNGAGACQQP